MYRSGVLNLFRLTEHFGPKKIPRNKIKKNPSEVVCFYLKNRRLELVCVLLKKIEKEVLCF
jgi:hypothetical protein